ncbi:MAG: PAAR-like domain-containing protein [Planctomycetota bacterium]
MFPASNAAAGMNIGFPDVCLTPVGPVTAPIPYADLAAHAQSTGAAVFVWVCSVPALNAMSAVAMTSGMEAGSAHSSLKQRGGYNMGNPIVSIEGKPGVNLMCPTNGNNFNNPMGAVLVPGAVNVFFTRDLPAEAGGTGAATTADPWRRDVTADVIADLTADCGLQADVRDGELTIRIAQFTSDLPARLSHVLRGSCATHIRFDLRDNPGGDAHAALAAAARFLPAGTTMAIEQDSDGDCITHLARHDSPQAFPPITVQINRRSASAAELFAAVLGFHHRATVVGGPAAGKVTSQVLQADATGATRLVSVANWSLPDGSPATPR